MLLCEWAREFKMSRKTLERRLARGWRIGQALNRPVRARNSITKAKAIELGDYYYDSIPCKNCGCKIRLTRNSDCPACKRERAKI